MDDLEPPASRDSMAAGFGLGLLLHFLGQVGWGVLAVVLFGEPGALAFVLPWFFLGWTQLVYMVPAAIWYHVQGRRRTATMLWIMTAVAFLVTSACAASMSRETWTWLF